MRGTPKHAISAKSFINPLLLTLGELSGFKPDVTIQSDACYNIICTKMGITLEQFGKPEGVTAYNTVRWIQAAFKTLVTEGLAAREGRGRWKLTPDGVVKAQTLRNKKGSQENSVSDETMDVVSLPVGTGDMGVDAYHPDPYIRGLALEQTPCYGSYSDKSDTCCTCPVKNRCVNAMVAQLSQLALVLAKEDEEAEKAQKDPDTEKPVAVKPKTKASPKSAVNISGDIQRITCQHLAFCKKCGEQVAKGEDAYWIRSTQNSDYPPGIYHLHCYEDKE